MAVFGYVFPILLILIIVRYIQLKRSIKGRKYDYTYYEDGPYGERPKKPTTWIGKLKKALGFKYYSWLFVLVLTQTACDKTIDDTEKGDYQTGIFCINEGVFGQTSGTISHYNPATKMATAKIFNQANSRDLGNVVQSLHLEEELAYIVVNNADKIEVVAASTFVEMAQITGLAQPRYLVTDGQKGYVSQWGADGLSGSIGVLDLDNNTVATTIAVGKGPEEILLHQEELYVPLIGGYDSDNKVVVLSTNTQQITHTITVGDKPSRCIADRSGQIWVLCGGKTVYTTYPTIDFSASTSSVLIQLDANNKTVVFRKDFGVGKSATNFTYNAADDLFYYTRENQIWEYNPATSQERAIAQGQFYGMDFNPNDQHIYATSNSGIDAAQAKKYTLEGLLVDSFSVGVFANGFEFLH